MKTEDRAITLSAVIAFFIGIFVIIIKGLNNFGYISMGNGMYNILLVLLFVSLAYLISVMIINIARVIENGKSKLPEEEKENNRHYLVKMVVCSTIATIVIFMSYYIVMTI